MQGYYDIEKHKAVLVDGKWESDGLISTETHKNFITFGVRLNQHIRTSMLVLSHFNRDNLNSFSSQQRLWIGRLQEYTKVGKMTTPKRDETNFEDMARVQGAFSAGKEIPSVVYGTPNTITTEARWDPPSVAPRVIRTIGCSYSSSYNNAASVLLLPNPCVQETNELLIIKYRYNWYDSTNEKYSNIKNPYFTNFVAKKLAVGDVDKNPFKYPTEITYSSYDQTKIDNPIDVDMDGEPNSSNDWVYRNYLEGFVNARHSFANDEAIGRLLATAKFFNGTSGNDVLEGFTDEVPPYEGIFCNTYNVKVRRPNDTVINSTFHKSLNQLAPVNKVPKPFLDTDNLGNGLGRLELSDSIVNGDTSYENVNGVAELFRTHITKSGAIGTSEYKLSKRFFTGVVNQNGWASRCGSYFNAPMNIDSQKIANGDGSPILDTGLVVNDDNIGQTARNGIGQHSQIYAFPEFISVNTKPLNGRDSIFVRSMFANDQFEYIEFNASSTPALPVTEIKQLEGFEDGTIIVACQDTGLWKISRNVGDPASAATVTHILPAGLVDNTKCHAFASNAPRNTGYLGTKWYAIFGREMATSTDQGDNWTILNATTSPAYELPELTDPEFILALGVDPENVDERMFIWESKFEFLDDGTYDSVNLQDREFHGFWYSIGGSSTTSDSVQFTDGSPSGQYSYPIQCTTNLHNMIGRDEWLIGSQLATFGATTGTGDRFFRDTSRDSMIYEVDRNKYSIFTNHFSSSSGILGPDNGMAVVAFESILIDNNPNPEILRRFTPTDRNNDEDNGFDVKHLSVGRGLGLLTTNQPAFANSFNNVYGEFRSDLITMAIFDHSHSLLDNGNDHYIDELGDVWEYYGWNGSSWVAGFEGSKPTHTSKDPLINGLDAAFFELEGSEGDSDTFILDDIFDTYAYDGIVKDDTTSFSVTATCAWGAAIKGTGTFPSIIPAPAGLTTVPHGMDLCRLDYDRESLICHEDGYIGMHGSATSVFDTEYDTGLLCNDLDGDFKITFRMSSIMFEYARSLSASYYGEFGFMAKSNIPDRESVDLGPKTEPEFGVRLRTTESDEVEYCGLEIMEGDNLLVTTYGRNDYAPSTDQYEYERIGSDITFTRNGELLHTFTGYGGTLKAAYNGRSDAYSLNIWDAMLTFDDPRSVVKIGNGTDTGTFDPNFGKMSYEYFKGGTNPIFIDGVAATILPNDGKSIPAAGQVYINRGTGELVFNPSDAGKTVSCSWLMIPKINE
ncbi:hypothetical protein GD1_139 [Paraglaciecola Antarctic GD virus 1]|nr:hypothetical protein GD1_139 [Paraglaciecola Antarctic GD virus 1]